MSEAPIRTTTVRPTTMRPALALGSVAAVIAILSAQSLTIALGFIALAGSVGLVFLPGLAAALLVTLMLTNTLEIAADHGVPSTGVAVMAGMFVILCARAVLMGEKLGFLLPIGVVAAGHVAFLATGLLWVEEPASTIAVLVETAKGWLIALALIGLVVHAGRLRQVGRGIVAGLGSIAALAVVQHSLGLFDNDFLGFANAKVLQIAGELHGRRISGPWPDANFFAQTLVVGLPVAAVTAWSDPRIPFRLIGLVAVPVILAAIILTYSRGGLVGVATVAFVAMLMSRAFWPLILAGVLVAMLGFSIAPQDLGERLVPMLQAVHAVFTGEFGSIEDPSLSQRLGLLAAAARMFVDNPVLGVGAGQYTVLYQDYALALGYEPTAPPRAHNRILEVLAENGLAGLAVLLALCAAATGIAIQAARALELQGRPRDGLLVRAFIVSFAGYWATAFFLHDAYPRFFWLQLGILFSTWWLLGGAGRKEADHDRSH